MVFSRESSLFIIITVFALFYSCNSDVDLNTYHQPQSFVETNVMAKQENTIKLEDGSGSYLQTNFVIHEDLLYFIRPFKSKVEVIDMKTNKKIKELKTKATENAGDRTNLVGGILSDLLIGEENYYALEIMTDKIIAYDKNWTLKNTFYPPSDMIFPMTQAGVFEIVDDQIILSWDDPLSRSVRKMSDLDKNQPIIMGLDLKKGTYETLLTAQSLYRAMEVDTIPDFRMAYANHQYFLTKQRDATMYRFDSDGVLIDKNDYYKKYIASKKQGAGRQDIGYSIRNIHVETNSVTYFLAREVEGDEKRLYEVVHFDLEDGVYWAYSIPSKSKEIVRLLQFGNGQLHYLYANGKQTEIRTVGLRH